jgi:hypothetical protein
MLHPNVHRAFSPWSEDQTLHVACMYSNPQRWPVRRELMNDFRLRLESNPNVKLYVGEVAFGDRPYEVTDPGNPRDFQFRTSHELWLKENVLNLVVQRMPVEARYIAYLDGDVQCSRYDWALEAIHQLQHYHAVQLFHQFVDTDFRHRPYSVTNGFAYSYANAITPKSFLDPAAAQSPGVSRMEQKSEQAAENRYRHPRPHRPHHHEPHHRHDPHHDPRRRDAIEDAKAQVWWGATGLGWAFRRETWNLMGGLYDTAILGSADWIMAYGMVGLADGLEFIPECAPYYQSVKRWQQGALALKADIGYLDNTITHYWHGAKANRFYRTREQILVENAFDPYMDLRRDAQGLWQLTGDKPKLRDDLRHYFRARNEMDQNLGEGSKLLA